MTTEPLRHEPEPTVRPLAIGLTVLAGALLILIRIRPHPANLTPMGAMGLFGGAKLRGWKAYFLPLALMVVSDVALWIHADFDSRYLFHASTVYVCVSLLIYIGIGRWLRDRESPLKVFGASLLGSLQFFVITNFCVWLLQPFENLDGWAAADIYTRDVSGLLTCFARALPFFKADSPVSLHAVFVGNPSYGVIYLVVGDLLFSIGLFVLHGALARAAFPAERSVARPSVQITEE